MPNRSITCVFSTIVLPKEKTFVVIKTWRCSMEFWKLQSHRRYIFPHEMNPPTCRNNDKCRLVDHHNSCPPRVSLRSVRELRMRLPKFWRNRKLHWFFSVEFGRPWGIRTGYVPMRSTWSDTRIKMILSDHWDAFECWHLLQISFEFPLIRAIGKDNVSKEYRLTFDEMIARSL